MKEFCGWFISKFDLSKEIAIDNLRSLKETKMIFTQKQESNFEEDEELIFLEEKEFYDFNKKTEDHHYLYQLMLEKDFLLLR